VFTHNILASSAMSTRISYDIFFTGPPNDPRHNCVMIGFLDETNRRPFYLAFETPDIVVSETVTTVCDQRHLWCKFKLILCYRFSATIVAQ
jgi:hypothetical protein